MTTTDGPGFVHLHVHTSFSLREGALTIAKLTKLAAADGMPALAITDTNNLFGALEFSEKLSKEGVQPITGIQLTVDFGDGALFGRDIQRHARGSVVILACTEAGYTNIMRLASEAFTRPEPGDEPHIAFDRLLGSTEGLILLTGGPNGAIDRVWRPTSPRPRRRGSTGWWRSSGPERLRRAAAPRPARGAAARAAARRAGLRQGAAARRHQRALLRRRRRPRGPRRADLHRRRAGARHAGPAPALARAPLPHAGRDGEALRRPAGGHRQHGRDRAPLLLSPAHPQADPAELHDAGRHRRSTPRRRCASSPTRASRRASPPTARRRASRGGLPGAARLRARHHRAHEVPGLLPDRVGLHQMGQGPGHPGRAGPRLGRGLARGLRAHHHRPRPDALRAAVRAVPQPRAHLDAGFRHRLLPDAARGGDPVRAPPLRARPRGADRHLRLVPGARRAAQRRPRAGDAARARSTSSPSSCRRTPPTP